MGARQPPGHAAKLGTGFCIHAASLIASNTNQPEKSKPLGIHGKALKKVCWVQEKAKEPSSGRIETLAAPGNPGECKDDTPGATPEKPLQPLLPSCHFAQGSESAERSAGCTEVAQPLPTEAARASLPGPPRLSHEENNQMTLPNESDWTSGNGPAPSGPAQSAPTSPGSLGLGQRLSRNHLEHQPKFSPGLCCLKV